MISEKMLKEMAINQNAYLKGYDLYEFGKVKLSMKMKKNNKTLYKFKVDGKMVSFVIDENENIDNVQCQCFEKGICKEVIASLLYLINNNPKKKLEELLKNTKSSIGQ
ncbi:MAG: hypothetical protein E7184_02055 [Erysipelotrichaceae bacterium]|nr:hypothetical protein [Erysipelotrichaceae bacterium]